MWIFLLRITPPSGSRREVLAILKTVQGPTLAQPGCLGCAIYEGLGEDVSILYVENWSGWDQLHQHILSGLYSRLLAAMDLSAVAPEIKFYEADVAHGIELIESIRAQTGRSV